MEIKTKKLLVQSSAFSHNGHIPSKYTCEGENINPPIEIGDVPDDTKALALIVEDPDAPSGVFTHWVVWNILPSDTIEEKTRAGISGMNDFHKTGYGGPCPPSGTHRYYFRVYALDKMLRISAGESKNALLEGMQGHILAFGEIMGRYRKGKAKDNDN